MAAPQIVSLPPFFTLSDGMRIVVTAIAATSGSTVSGVTVANVSIDVDPSEVDEATPRELVGTAFTMGDLAAQVPLDPHPKQPLTADEGWLQLRYSVSKRIPRAINGAHTQIRRIRKLRRRV